MKGLLLRTFGRRFVHGTALTSRVTPDGAPRSARSRLPWRVSFGEHRRGCPAAGPATWKAVLATLLMVGALATPVVAQSTTAIDAPQPSATVCQPFTIYGWAACLATAWSVPIS